MSAVIGGMLVAAQGPICARLSEELNRDSLACRRQRGLETSFPDRRHDLSSASV
ncbi:hypothetical protein [Mesorhizobium sp. 131-3-5]|uniref:hypothetical protein n=1 Tax=Mesorhizobium sp. 131-3-5 TaxID=2744520 RepID=UPI0019281505|nr:hypothetical protein [Mesorhizobium sp. 131-3-5]